MVTHHPPIHLVGWSRGGRHRGHDVPCIAATQGGGGLRQAYAAWHALPWPTRQTALQHAVVGNPHPDPVTAAIMHRWAIAQLGIPRRSWTIAITAATILAGLLAGLVPLGLSLSGRIGLCAAASLTAFALSVIAVGIVRGQAAEIAYASQLRL